jgi:hypothetical protein
MIDPIEIDTQLASLYAQAQQVRQRIARAKTQIHVVAGDRYRDRGWSMSLDTAYAKVRSIAVDESVLIWDRQRAQKALEELDAAEARKRAAR